MKRSKDQVLFGVCAGIAERLNLDPIWVRLTFALCGLTFLYCILMIVMEEPDEN